MQVVFAKVDNKVLCVEKAELTPSLAQIAAGGLRQPADHQPPIPNNNSNIRRLPPNAQLLYRPEPELLHTSY